MALPVMGSHKFNSNKLRSKLYVTSSEVHLFPVSINEFSQPITNRKVSHLESEYAQFKAQLLLNSSTIGLTG
jgi:hypothetical protein